jgi:hypothetical protein
VIEDVLAFAASISWIAAITLLAIAIIAVLLAIRLRRPGLGLVGVVPVILGALGLAFGFDVEPADPFVWVIVALGLAVLGVLGGNPITVYVLGLTSAADPTSGAHGGIVVAAGKDSHGHKKKGRREVLRGGWVIGYLERLAIVAAIVLGHFEIIAGIIAIKGLGRFTELDNAEARERFIIGTLTSMLWAAACAVLIVLGRPA